MMSGIIAILGAVRPLIFVMVKAKAYGGGDVLV
jgi:hypothetical protein